MKALPPAAFVVALVALVIALVALVTAPEGADDVRTELAKVTAGLDRLGRKVGALEGAVAEAASAESGLPAEVRELSGRVGKLAEKVARLDRAAAESAKEREAAPPAPAAVDEEKLRGLVEAEIRAYYARRSRIPVDKLPEAAKQAALKAAAGFKIEHGHNMGRARDGKRMYDIDGKVGGRSRKIRVTSDGRVLAIDGRKPGTAPATAPAKPAGGGRGEPFF